MFINHNMSTPLLSIIIPVYNEDQIVASSLPPILGLAANHEVIIVNDGSTDQTKEILEALQKNYSFQLINQITNQGKGAAVKRGFAAAAGDFVIIYDADAEYSADDVERLFKIALEHLDERMAIYGSRFLENRPVSFHYLVNFFLTGLTNLLFRSRLTDMETCLKILPKSFLPLLKLRGRRFEIEPEITAQLLKNQYTILEVPISYHYRGYKEGKKIRAKDGLLAVGALLAEKLFRP
jgi:glycosyltransferase involved in cell wall biosynthesis